MPYSQRLLTETTRSGMLRWPRFLRAMWHDTRALLREFQRPILTFFLAVFVGGWVYGELLVFAGYPRVPYVDLPYFMLALMTLETPTAVPPEWYLVIFWYVLPAVAVYIIGQGAVDFLRLFFNRNERRDAWELAVASTYRNHIIVTGIGHVGYRVIRTLVQMGFEVIGIDTEIDEEMHKELHAIHVPLVLGDARQKLTLSDAGLVHARAVIVCTSSDHVNLEITMRARDLNPDIRIVTRMWDDRFAAQLKRFLNVEVMSASDLAAPAFAGTAVGVEITQTLNIGGEDFSMIRITVEQGSFMDGQAIGVLQEDEMLDIVLHARQGEDPIVHPSDKTVVRGGDVLVLFSHHAKVTEIVARNRPRSRARLP